MKATPMRLLSVFVLVILMLGVMAACLTPQPTPVAIDSQAVGAQEEFKTIRVKGLSEMRGVVTVGGAASFASTTSFVGAVTLSTNMIHSSSSITPTDGGILTPTAKLVTLTPGGAVSITLGACTTGNETILYNSLNANVVITDTGNGVLAGNQTLGQFDALMLSCYGSKWVQISAVSAN